jgi:hypothetical protein
MPPELPRTGLNGSALVGLLAQLALPTPQDRPAAPPSFVEGLGSWLGWKEAIALSAVLQAAPTPGAAAGGAVPTTAAALAALEAEFGRVQHSLAAAIDHAVDHPLDDDDGSFLPWRRRCFGLQQAMEQALGPLRAQARAVLLRQGARHAALARLATLDAALATALAPREQAQLALMPVLLEKHFVRHGAARAAFRDDLRQLLRAELELRLQPALGLLDALRATHTEPS